MKNNDSKALKIKPVYIIAGGAVLVAVILAIIILPNSLARTTKEEELKTSIVSMANKFYTEFYYEQVSSGKSSADVTSFLDKFKTTGIKINLDNLERYNGGEFKDSVKDFTNDVTKKACDKNNTMAVIYPKEPYGKKDFKIVPELDCGFDNNKK